MTPIAAILLCCTHGDRDVAATVYAAAVQAHVDPALALAVGCVESGLRAGNPLGVRACYGAPPQETARCIAIGVASLANRLRSCRQNAEAPAQAAGTGHRRRKADHPQRSAAPAARAIPVVASTAGHDDVERCACRRYNRSKGAVKYAAKVCKIAAFVRRRSK